MATPCRGRQGRVSAMAVSQELREKPSKGVKMGQLALPSSYKGYVAAGGGEGSWNQSGALNC